MKRIQQLKIKNFKAFQEEQIFDFRGKNVLVYGNNGSGKSSLFWALYTFLQSSIKASDAEIEKYFKYFDEIDSTTHQSLLNVFMDQAVDSYIEMTYGVTGENENTFETKIISNNNGISTRNNPEIQELTQSSDFINYKLLHNFYNASHKQEVNLWSVFERDIFPFITFEESTTPWIDKIKELTLDVPRTPNNYKATGRRKTSYIDKVNNLNTSIITLLSDIENSTNDFLKKYFFNDEDKIKIYLKFEKTFTYDKIKELLWEEDKDSIRHSLLQIKLMVEVYDEAVPKWREIHRVQSFLNEAQLTRIAISIRVGALRARVQGTDFKVLVLDDMLNSLDMANRVDVMRIILNKDNHQGLKYFDDFQKIILTHDKGFYELLKRQTNDNDWIYYKFDKDENLNNQPKVSRGLTKIQEARILLDSGEFDACGIKLRKEAEDILSNYLNPEMKLLETEFKPLSKKIKLAYESIVGKELQNFKKLLSNKNLTIDEIKKIEQDIDSISDDELSLPKKGQLKTIKKRLFTMLIELYSVSHTKEKHLEDLKEILDRVLNSTAHHNDNNLYRNELKEAIEHMVELKTVLESN
ncbi:AAA family ATPase [Malaciobacter marinus]|uniref:AAA family ATPase n=1 Tax=Malaciobacter marinus TaxID=505249 RepID=UPI003B00FE82